MPRIPEQQRDILSRDVAAGILDFCWGNRSKFFRRYTGLLEPMSRSVFFTALAGEVTSKDNIEKITFIAETLNMLSPTDKRSKKFKQNVVNGLVKTCEVLVENPSIENLGKIKQFLLMHKGDLL